MVISTWSSEPKSSFQRDASQKQRVQQSPDIFFAIVFIITRFAII